MQSRTRLGHLLLRRQRPRGCLPTHPAPEVTITNRKPGYSTAAESDGSSPLFKPKSRVASLLHPPSSGQSSALISGSATQDVVLEDGQPSEHLHLFKENSGNSTSSEGGLFYTTGNREASSSSRRPWSYLPVGAGAGAAVVVLLTAAVAVSAEGENGYASHGEEMKIRFLTWKSSVAHALENLKDTLVLGMQGVLEAGSATSVLIQFLATVLFQASDAATDGLNAWWRPKVASLIADVAAHENRRKSVVDAGNGRVLDWLLDSVKAPSSVQNEAARALAYLLSDARTSEIALGRPQALPHLLRFAASLHTETLHRCGLDCHALTKSDAIPVVWLYMAACILKTTKHGKKAQVVQHDNELSRGRSMLVAAVMDIITSSCDVGGGPALKLPENAPQEDIATVLKVLREGGPLLNEEKTNEVIHAIKADRQGGGGFRDQKWTKKGQQHGRWIKFGLWDDLQGPQVYVPLAAWALGAWAQASTSNCEKIADLDKNGESLLTALQAPERTVKWHGAIAIKSLLQGEYNHLSPLAHLFSEPLLATAGQAGKAQDYTLARAAMEALSACVFCNSTAHEIVLEMGLPVMWELTKEADVKNPVQVPVANTLDILTSTGPGLSLDESKKWASILLRWVCSPDSDREARSAGSHILARVVDALGPSGIPISQTWLAMLLMDLITERKRDALHSKVKSQQEDKALGLVQTQVTQAAVAAATQLAKLVAQEAAIQAAAQSPDRSNDASSELPVADLLGLDSISISPSKKDLLPKVAYVEAATAMLKAVKALTGLSAENSTYQLRIVEAGGLLLLRRLLLGDDYDLWASTEGDQPLTSVPLETEHVDSVTAKTKTNVKDKPVVKPPLTTQVRKQTARLLSILSLQPTASEMISGDENLCLWLEDCADGNSAGNGDLKTRSYARTVLLNVSHMEPGTSFSSGQDSEAGHREQDEFSPRFEDMVFLVNPESIYWKNLSFKCHHGEKRKPNRSSPASLAELSSAATPLNPLELPSNYQEEEVSQEQPVMDVVFVHGLCGGPFKTWRVSDDKMSTTDKSGLVETIDQDAGREDTCWPREWLSHDLPHSRLLTLKYKTNLSQWSGATLPLQEVSSMLLDKLIAAGVGKRPTVFVTHSMGGLVVKQMLMQAARDKSRAHLVQQTGGIVFYSCPHFGSKLADMPWRMGYVLRPAPTIGELRSGSPRLEELNRFIRILHNKTSLEVLNFSETKVTPLVEGYGGLALRMEVVPIESAYPGYGDLVVLDGTDHVNSCKPLSRSDPAYTKTLEFLQKLEAASHRSKG